MENEDAKIILAKRLIALREELGLSQEELAEKIGITRQSLSLYEKSKRTINIDILLRISKVLKVSADYLLGVTDNKTTNDEIKAVCQYTGLSEKAIEQIKKCGKNCNTTLNDICESLQFWLVVQSLANFATVHRVIAEYSNNKSFSLPENEKELKILDNLTVRKDVEELHATKCFNYLIDYIEQLAGERGSKGSEDENNG